MVESVNASLHVQDIAECCGMRSEEQSVEGIEQLADTLVILVGDLGLVIWVEHGSFEKRLAVEEALFSG